MHSSTCAPAVRSTEAQIAFGRRFAFLALGNFAFDQVFLVLEHLFLLRGARLSQADELERDEYDAQNTDRDDDVTDCATLTDPLEQRRRLNQQPEDRTA